LETLINRKVLYVSETTLKNICLPQKLRAVTCIFPVSEK